MSSKKGKMLPDGSTNGSNLPASGDSATGFFAALFSALNPGESTDIELTRNHDNSATLRCPEQGKTLVKRESGNDVGYSYKPKKKK